MKVPAFKLDFSTKNRSNTLKASSLENGGEVDDLKFKRIDISSDLQYVNYFTQSKYFPLNFTSSKLREV